MNDVTKIPDEWREWYEHVVGEATDLYHDTLFNTGECKRCEYARWLDKDVECVVPHTILCPPVRRNISQLTGRFEIALRENTFD